MKRKLLIVLAILISIIALLVITLYFTGQNKKIDATGDIVSGNAEIIIKSKLSQADYKKLTKQLTKVDGIYNCKIDYAKQQLTCSFNKEKMYISKLISILDKKGILAVNKADEENPLDIVNFKFQVNE